MVKVGVCVPDTVIVSDDPDVAETLLYVKRPQPSVYELDGTGR